METILSKYSNQINILCGQYHVKTLFAFGSVLSDKFNDQSDVDLIVDIEDEDPFIYSENYFDLKFKLQDLFQRNVDLLERKALKNIFLIKEIDSTKILLYGK